MYILGTEHFVQINHFDTRTILMKNLPAAFRSFVEVFLKRIQAFTTPVHSPQTPTLKGRIEVNLEALCTEEI